MALSNELLAVLVFLLPGFVTAWVFRGLTQFPKPSQLGGVVQALIYTMFVQGGTTALEFLLRLGGRWYSVGVWGDDVRVAWSVVLAAALGVAMAAAANRDTVHRWLRRIGVTPRTSYPSEWYAEFSRSQSYVVLHLAGERRLYGWPDQWPNQPQAGHFSIGEAEWLVDEGRIPITGVRSILIRAQDVEMVEFMSHPNPPEVESGD